MLAIFTGSMGQGKTLSMSILAKFLQEKGKMKVYANYGLKGSEKLTNFEDILKATAGLVCLDEAQMLMDSRMFKYNIKFTHWLLQTRKKDLIVLGTTQSFDQVDLRARNVCDIIVECRKKNNTIYLQFINWQDKKLLRKYKIRNFQRFYGVYDTKEIVYPISPDDGNYEKEKKYGKRKI